MTDGVVQLREVTREDAGRLYEWRMDPDSRRMFRQTDVVPYEDHLAFLEHYFQSDNDDRWFIIEDATGPVGAHALYGITKDGGAECGRLVIAPAARGRGYARRSMRLMMACARAAGIRELRAEVLAGNEVSLRAHRAEGFADAGEAQIGDRRFIQLSATLAVT